MIHITDTVVFDERETRERAVRAMGPGGQNARRAARAVELRLDLAKSALPSTVKQRLCAIAGRRVTADGVLIVVGRADRSQARNRAAAHTRLLALLQSAANSAKIRTPTGVSLAMRQERMASKERRAAIKRSRADVNTHSRVR
jgi:ribosome-associated protein